jgi:hypothetical protein
MHGKEAFCRASKRKGTAKNLFVVHPKENARQRYSRTVNMSFPIMRMMFKFQAIVLLQIWCPEYMKKEGKTSKDHG